MFSNAGFLDSKIEILGLSDPLRSQHPLQSNQLCNGNQILFSVQYLHLVNTAISVLIPNYTYPIISVPLTFCVCVNWGLVLRMRRNDLFNEIFFWPPTWPKRGTVKLPSTNQAAFHGRALLLGSQKDGRKGMGYLCIFKHGHFAR